MLPKDLFVICNENVIRDVQKYILAGFPTNSTQMNTDVQCEVQEKKTNYTSYCKLNIVSY